ARIPMSTAVRITLKGASCPQHFLLKNFCNILLLLQKAVWKFLVAFAAENCIVRSHCVTTRTDFQDICFNLGVLAALWANVAGLSQNMVAVATRSYVNGRGRWQGNRRDDRPIAFFHFNAMR